MYKVLMILQNNLTSFTNCRVCCLFVLSPCNVHAVSVSAPYYLRIESISSLYCLYLYRYGDSTDRVLTGCAAVTEHTEAHRVISYRQKNIRTKPMQCSKICSYVLLSDEKLCEPLCALW